MSKSQSFKFKKYKYTHILLLLDKRVTSLYFVTDVSIVCLSFYFYFVLCKLIQSDLLINEASYKKSGKETY